jgi:hypothetical protein
MKHELGVADSNRFDFSARFLQRVRQHMSRLPRERRAGDPARGISNRIHGIGIFFCS